MRKQVAPSPAQGSTTAGGDWLNLDQAARVSVSSEDAGFPVENALAPESALAESRGWKAEHLGPATITLDFDTPQAISKVLLHFTEPVHERSQEWSLSARLADGTKRELLRQGWNFSPSGSSEQREQHTLQLASVAALILTIDPDRGRDRYPATLTAWRVGAAS